MKAGQQQKFRKQQRDAFDHLTDETLTAGLGPVPAMHR
ncbi:MAG: hypothetical protein GPOALKHO_001533 [Sodalis sp.]|nr:MAG: hypothetical protein GPOALKHO_001533 [Sodalis sp.]